MITYSNQDFDEIQRYAFALTDADRKAGREAPAYGYSLENIGKAQSAVLAWHASNDGSFPCE